MDVRQDSEEVKKSPSSVKNLFRTKLLKLKKYRDPIIFALSMAMIGGLIVIRSFAATPIRNLEGEIQISEVDDFQHGVSKKLYNLKLANENYYRIMPGTVDLSAIKQGDRIRAYGTPKNHKLKPDKIERLSSAKTSNNTPSLLQKLQPKAEAATNTRKVLVLLVNFQNDKSKPFNPEQLRKFIFTAPKSANAFIKESSFNQTSLTGINRVDGDVAGWYTIKYDNVNCDQNHNAWADAARAAAQKNKVNISGYTTVVYFFPHSDCSWTAGRTEALTNDPRNSYMWLNGDVQLATTAHEFGHALGFPHADALRCYDNNNTPVPISAACVPVPQGDPFDTMGTFPNTRQYSAYNKTIAGWLAPSNIGTVSKNGTFAVSRMETPASGIQSLRVPITTGPNQGKFYYIEYRQPFGLDDATANGLYVRLGVDTGSLNTVDKPHTQLLDAKPNSDTFSDAAVPVGGNINDGKIKIQFVSESANVANVLVDLDSSPPPSPPPPATYGLRARYYKFAPPGPWTPSSIPALTPVKESVVPTVDHALSASQGTAANAFPAEAGQTDFYARYTGFIEPPGTSSDGYNQWKICIQSDDGVRLMLQDNGLETGTFLIDDWTSHSTKTNCSNLVSLKNNQKYQISLEYFQASAGANIKLMWQNNTIPSSPLEIIPVQHLYDEDPSHAIVIVPPTNLREGFSAGHSLIWDPPASTLGLSGYRIYHDGYLAASTTNPYGDDPNPPYVEGHGYTTYTVKSVFGTQESAPSAPLSIERCDAAC